MQEHNPINIRNTKRLIWVHGRTRQGDNDGLSFQTLAQTTCTWDEIEMLEYDIV